MPPRRRRRQSSLKFVTTGPLPYDWERINEHSDVSAIRQETETLCTAACVQMLLWPEGGGLTQQQLSGGQFLLNQPALSAPFFQRCNRLTLIPIGEGKSLEKTSRSNF